MTRFTSLTIIMKSLMAVLILGTCLSFSAIARAEEDSAIDGGGASDDEPTVARELSGFDPNMTAAYVVHSKAAKEADAENRSLDRALDDKTQRIWMRH